MDILQLPNLLLSLLLSKVRQSSMIAIQIFDHKKFRRRDQGEYFSLRGSFLPHDLIFKGFLGVYNIPAADAIQFAGSPSGV